MCMDKSEIQKIVTDLVEKEKLKNIRHWCPTCRYFTFQVDEKGVEQEGIGNRGCRFEGQLKVEGWWTDAVCLSWELQPDPRKRKPSFVSYWPKEM